MSLTLPTQQLDDHIVRQNLDRISTQWRRGAFTVFNLKEDFGARGDGVVSDTQARNAALSKMPAYSALYIPGGTYVLGTVPDALTRSDITIFGAGEKATRLLIPSGAGFNTFWNVTAARVQIYGMTLVSQETSTSQYALMLDGADDFRGELHFSGVAGVIQVGNTTRSARINLRARGTWNVDALGHNPPISHKRAVGVTYDLFMNGNGTTNFVNAAMFDITTPGPTACDGGIYDMRMQYTSSGQDFSGYRYGVKLDAQGGDINNQHFGKGAFDHWTLAGCLIRNDGNDAHIKNITFNDTRLTQDHSQTTGLGRASGVVVAYNASPAANNPLTVRFSSLSLNFMGANAVVTSGGNEIQEYSVDATGGTYTLTFGANTTAALAFDAKAETIQAALTGLASIGANNCRVWGGPGASGGGVPYQVMFCGTKANANQATLTANAGSLTGGAGTVTISTLTQGYTNEVQRVEIDATGGTFTLTFGANTTSALAWDASAATVQAALEALASIGAGNVSVTLSNMRYKVTFQGTLAGANQAAMTSSAAGLTGGASTATVSTLCDGAATTGDQVKVCSFVGVDMNDGAPGPDVDRHAAVVIAANHTRVIGCSMSKGGNTSKTDYFFETRKDTPSLVVSQNDIELRAAGPGVFSDEFAYVSPAAGRVVTDNAFTLL